MEDDGKFSAAIDIRRARAHKITALGLRSAVATPGVDSSAVTSELSLEGAPALPDFDDADRDMKGRTASLLERSQRKLLDLTLRNPLLNHRSTKTSLRIICPDPARLEDRLATGTRIRKVPVPQPSSQAQDEITNSTCTRHTAYAALLTSMKS